MRYYKKHSIQTSILWEIGVVVKHNFFEDLAQQVPAICITNPSQILLDREAEIAELKAANERLQLERDLLFKIVNK